MSWWANTTFQIYNVLSRSSRKLSYGANHDPVALVDPTPPTPNRETAAVYRARLGETFKHDRYVALGKLGDGRYSTVWLAKDLQTQSPVAIKILRTDCYGTEHDIYELEVLQDITRISMHSRSPGKSQVMTLLDNFQHTGPSGNHVCLVSPVLGCHLGTLASRFPDKRIPVQKMKHITRQLLQGLDYLHKECSVIHTGTLETFQHLLRTRRSQRAVKDYLPQVTSGIKDEGIPPSTELSTPMVTEMSPIRTKILDFGVACWVGRRLSDNIQPEHLQAPEVILRAPWGTPVDIWSLGCLVIEFVKGHLAFPAGAHPQGLWTSEDDHLAQHMEVLGPMPDALLRRRTRTGDYFDSKGNLLRIPKLKPTNLSAHMDGDRFPLTRPDDMSEEEVPVFVDFLRGAMALDPDRRKTAADLLEHPWLKT